MDQLKNFLCSLLGSVLLSVVGLCADCNIVLFVTDDLSPDLGCYGNSLIKTPNLNKVARESTLYKYAYATTASCSASRSVILSGLHNHSNGQFGHLHNYHHFQTQSWVQSLPVLLRRLGYHTARIGKFHVGPEPIFDFDEELPATEHERNPERLAEGCRTFLEAQVGFESPFFLYIATNDPHRSGNKALDQLGKPDRFGNALAEKDGVEANKYDPSEILVPEFLPDTVECRAELAEYYESVSRIDRGIGKLIEILKLTGHWENTLFVFTSDHGMAFPGAKTSVYEAGLRVPLVVRCPDNPLQKTVWSDALVSLVDITPTLLDFAGGLDRETGKAKGLSEKKWQWETKVPDEEELHLSKSGEMKWIPYTFHGRSFLPTLGLRNTPGWDSISASHTFHEIQMYYPMRVYRDRQFKIIWNIAYQLPFPFASDLWASSTWQKQFGQGPKASYGFRTVQEMTHHPQYELFDMQIDPEEKNNLADDPAYAGILTSYLEKLKQFQLESGDPWALKSYYD